MPSSCSVPHCSNSHRKGYTLVNFPKDTNQRNAWIVAMGHPKCWTPRSTDRVCEVHFNHADWLHFKKLLKPCTVPSLFTDQTKVRFSSLQEGKKKCIPHLQRLLKKDRELCEREKSLQMEQHKLSEHTEALEAELCFLEKMLRWKEMEVFEQQCSVFDI